jgi:predicted RNA-binding Zn-ribbon protein involved in translation (DUF1610 family)
MEHNKLYDRTICVRPSDSPFPVKCDHCGHSHFITDCWDICREEGGNILWSCDKCGYIQDFKNTYNVAIMKFLKDNGTTWNKYKKLRTWRIYKHRD